MLVDLVVSDRPQLIAAQRLLKKVGCLVVVIGEWLNELAVGTKGDVFKLVRVVRVFRGGIGRGAEEERVGRSFFGFGL